MADTVFSNGTVVEVDWAQDVNDHVYDKGATPHHAASLISITAVSSLSATNVQAALAEIVAERVASTNGSANNLNLTGTTTAIGPIVVPSGATGTQVRQAAEVVTANSQTGAGNLPTGTTAQRPTPAAGMIRNNTDTTSIEAYANGQWKLLTYNQATRVTTTSGTNFDFTGIPDEAVEICVWLRNVSLSGTDHLLVQLGDSGGFTTTGYVAQSNRYSATSAVEGTSTAGFILATGTAGNTFTGRCTIQKWLGTPRIFVQEHNGRTSTSTVVNGGGDVVMTNALTQIRITRTGTNTFDSGEIMVSWR